MLQKTTTQDFLIRRSNSSKFISQIGELQGCSNNIREQWSALTSILLTFPSSKSHSDFRPGSVADTPSQAIKMLVKCISDDRGGRWKTLVDHPIGDLSS